MTNFQSFQAIVARSLMALALVHVVILGAIAGLLGRDILLTLLTAAALGAAPLAAWRLGRPMKLVGFALAVALAGQTSILVFLFSGHPWQVEMHFYYFAVLAMLSGFCEWPVLVAAAGLIAVHHLSLDFLLPDAVYPGGSNFLRVMVHAVVVVIETAMLIGIGYAIRAAFGQADAARHEAEATAHEVQLAGVAQERELVATTLRADRMSELLERFQREMSELDRHPAHRGGRGVERCGKPGPRRDPCQRPVGDGGVGIRRHLAEDPARRRTPARSWRRAFPRSVPMRRSRRISPTVP